MVFDNLTPEQTERAKACKTPEDVLALAKSEGYPLSDQELQELAGGTMPVGWGGESDPQCPRCQSGDITNLGNGHWRCNKCGKEWSR